MASVYRETTAPGGLRDVVRCLWEGTGRAPKRIVPAAPDLASLAFSAGYADQAHLSRDCREVTGVQAREFFRAKKCAMSIVDR